jgi:hypothetical protein
MSNSQIAELLTLYFPKCLYDTIIDYLQNIIVDYYFHFEAGDRITSYIIYRKEFMNDIDTNHEKLLI